MAETLAAQYAGSIQEEIERLKEEQRSGSVQNDARKKKRGYGAAGVAAAKMEEGGDGDGRIRSQYGRSSSEQNYTPTTRPDYSQYQSREPDLSGKNKNKDPGYSETGLNALASGVGEYGASALSGGSAAAASSLPAGTTALGAGSYSIPAGASVPTGYTAVGTAADGGTLVASNTSMGGGSSSLLGMSYGAWAGIAAGVVASYVAYQNRKKAQKAAGGGNLTGDEIIDTVPGSNLITKVVPKSVIKQFNPGYKLDKMIWGSTKSDDQILRDRVRKGMQEYGALDEKWQLKLADGTTFDFGKDGGARLANADGSSRKYSDIDWNNALAAESVADTNPLGFMATAGFGNQKTQTDMVGYFTNAVTQNAKDRAQVDANIKSVYNSLGYKTRQDAYSTLDGLVEAGKLTKEAADVYKQSVNKYLPDAEQPQEEQQQERINLELPEEPKMGRKRMRSNVDFGFSPSGPRAGGASTGVNEYLSMLSNMQRGRNG